MIKLAARYLIIIPLLLGIRLSAQTKTDSILVAADKLITDGVPEKALKLVEQQIQIDSLSERLFCKRGEILLAMGKHTDAYDNFNIALELHPGYAEGYFNRGIFFYNVGEPQLAVMDFNDAMFFSKSDTLTRAALLNRGNALFMAGQKEKALRDFDSLAIMYPEEITYQNNKAAALSALGKHEKAADIYRTILKKDRNYVNAYVNLGYELILIGHYKKALKTLKKGVKKDKQNATMISNLGLAYYHLGNLSKALDVTHKSLEVNPSNAYAYRNLGLIYVGLGDKKSACRAFNKALNLDFKYIYGDEVDNLIQEHCP